MYVQPIPNHRLCALSFASPSATQTQKATFQTLSTLSAFPVSLHDLTPANKMKKTVFESVGTISVYPSIRRCLFRKLPPWPFILYSLNRSIANQRRNPCILRSGKGKAKSSGMYNVQVVQMSNLWVERTEGNPIGQFSVLLFYEHKNSTSVFFFNLRITLTDDTPQT